MKQRTITGLAIFLVTLIILLTKIIIGTTIIFDVFWGLIMMGCAYEMSNLLKKHNKYNHWWLITFFPVALFALLYLEMALQMSALISLVLVLALCAIMVLIGFFTAFFANAKTEDEMRANKIRLSKAGYAFSKSMNNLLGFVYPTIPMMLMFPLNHLAEVQYIFGQAIDYVSTVSIILVALCFLIPYIADTFAYLVGKTFGGPRLCPKISPKKTISGFVGSIIATILIVEAIYLILVSVPGVQNAIFALNIEWWSIGIIALLGAVVCTGGDLFESFLKRKAGVKDSGNILPGHGGLLDRMDGFVFVTLYVAIVALILVL